MLVNVNIQLNLRRPTIQVEIISNNAIINRVQYKYMDKETGN